MSCATPPATPGRRSQARRLSQPQAEGPWQARGRRASGPRTSGPAVDELREHSDRFAELWDSGAVGRHEAARKTIDHPQVGPLRLDCDVLTVAGSDLRIMVYTAEPGTEDAERLTLLTVLGTQAMTG